MLTRFILFALSFLVCQNLHAAGNACFNYETFEHRGGVVGANRALTNYDHAQIAARNIAIPPLLAGGAYQIQVSKMRQLAMPLPWQHALPLLGGPLTFQESCMMTIERQAIGIIVDFQDPFIINSIAAGLTIPNVAALLGLGVPLVTQYLNHSVMGGGYRSTLATKIYRLRHNLPQNFFALAAGGVADTVLIHIREPRRVSKNVKELAYNSINNIPLYLSIKDMIDFQYNFLGIPVPDSATVLSADNLN